MESRRGGGGAETRAPDAPGGEVGHSLTLVPPTKTVNLKVPKICMGCGRRTGKRISDLSCWGRGDTSFCVASNAQLDPRTPTHSISGENTSSTSVGFRHRNTHYFPRALLRWGVHGSGPARGCGHQTGQATCCHRSESPPTPRTTTSQFRFMPPVRRIPTSDTVTRDIRFDL